jgi:hypothetical protein
MIRYDLEMSELIKAVTKLDKRWLSKAAIRTQRFEKASKYNEDSSKAIWSAVKPAFMAAQLNKCVFCERQFENAIYGKIEFDLEHFRPKSSVKIWPVEALHSFKYDFGTGDANELGYYWLPYDLSNYAASCKACNSALKSNYFPIAGKRLTSRGDLASEECFLCYPLGSADTDPEKLITFVGTVVVPAASEGHSRRRGQVIIDFFDLNGREQLHRERAKMIMLVGASLAAIDAGEADETDRRIVTKCQTPEMPHAGCLRAFISAWKSDGLFARELLREAKRYFLTESGELPTLLAH